MKKIICLAMVLLVIGVAAMIFYISRNENENNIKVQVIQFDIMDDSEKIVKEVNVQVNDIINLEKYDGNNIKILEITDENVKLKYIYLTHSHMDHIEKAEELKNTYGGEILISRKGAENINNPEINLFNMINFEANNISNIDNLSHEDNEQDKEGNLPKQLYTSVDSRVDDKDILHIGKIELEVILTPRTYK